MSYLAETDRCGGKAKERQIDSTLRREKERERTQLSRAEPKVCLSLLLFQQQQQQHRVCG